MLFDNAALIALMLHNYVYVSCGNYAYVHAYVYAYIHAYVSASHGNYSTNKMQCINQTHVGCGAIPFETLNERI